MDNNKPKTDVKVRLSGGDGNIFAIMGKVSSALKRAGHRELAEEYCKAIFNCGSYDEALQLTMSYAAIAKATNAE